MLTYVRIKPTYKSYFSGSSTKSLYENTTLRSEYVLLLRVNRFKHCVAVLRREWLIAGPPVHSVNRFQHFVRRRDW